MVVPPPALFALAFAAGALANEAVPWPLAPASLHGAARIGGIALVAIAALLLAAPPALFARHRTTIVPHGDARELVTTGPYRVTRNPMYVGLAAAHVGLALWLDLGWSLAFVALPMLVIDRVVIPFEEANLERIFGEPYRAYRARVRRWL
jgi:protein-S-isoprenylcysteine O-methyltransferase Ste14